MNCCITTTRRSDLDVELLGTECAIDEDDPIFVAHLGALVLGKPLQHVAIMLDRAAASTGDPRAELDADFLFLVEQPPCDRLERERGIEQFVVPERSC